MDNLSTFAAQSWLITPAAKAAPTSTLDSAVGPGANAGVATATGGVKPRIPDQSWLLVLSGVVSAEFRGTLANDWRRGTVRIMPDLSAPLQHAVASHGIAGPPGNPGSHALAFQVEQCLPFAGLSSVFNQSQSGQAGYAVDTWRVHGLAGGIDAFTNARIDRLFNGIEAEIAVRNRSAVIHRLSYHITLLGKIMFVPNVLS